jgi:hypothetical protein
METLAAPALTQDFARHFAAEWRGKAAVAQYWSAALKLIPWLRFELTQVLVGVDSVVIHYRGHRGPVAEVFRFAPSGKVVSAAAHYL